MATKLQSLPLIIWLLTSQNGRPAPDLYDPARVKRKSQAAFFAGDFFPLYLLCDTESIHTPGPNDYIHESSLAWLSHAKVEVIYGVGVSFLIWKEGFTRNIVAQGAREFWWGLGKIFGVGFENLRAESLGSLSSVPWGGDSYSGSQAL